MLEKTLDIVQSGVKLVASVGTSITVFRGELLLLKKFGVTRGGAATTAALARAGRIIGIPTMNGGLGAMVGSSVFAGYCAGEMVDKAFDQLRGKTKVKVIEAQGTVS